MQPFAERAGLDNMTMIEKYRDFTVGKMDKKKPFFRVEKHGVLPKHSLDI